MSQISIPVVALYPLEDQPKRVDPSLLEDAPRIPPELYVDDDHHGAVYCPDCGVMCSRMPRREAKRKDQVDAFYFHIKGFETVACPHRQSGRGGDGDGSGREKKAINLVTFAGWKDFQDDDEDEDDFSDQSRKPKREVQGGTGLGRRGFELVFDENGSLLNAGEFRTVRRLVYLAQRSLDINVQFDDQEAVRLGDLIVSVEKVQKDSARYIGRSLLIFGMPTSIKGGNARHFFNFQSPGHEVSAHCDPRIVVERGWKNYERDNYYIFYGLVEGSERRTTVRVLQPGQIDRIPVSAHKLFDSLR
ncbi:hypothetical protein NA645_11645 [Pseudomonas stutzeri]|uniref:hypothetical protein n=1 Tax=Stutzerimonas stutzeri TaxID=316 RepID=UPI00210BBFFF|nr:hypothetical protein [Stutzerimonas stutzeri]MCQ4308634.1 hypothetical protein [Stutzerimonas stutzeri]